MFFDRSIDSKPKYEDSEGNILIDLGTSIFQDDTIFSGIPFSMYRVADKMDMRPDLLSLSAYGSDEYTELVMKYNNIQNPFSIQHGDILVVPSEVHIEKHIGIRTDKEKSNQDALIRNYHKFIDPNKAPDTVGSETNDSTIPSDGGVGNGGSFGGNGGLGGGNNGSNGTPLSDNYREPNIAPIGSTPITEVDGKLYFGADSNMKCATNGVSTADYLKTVINNSIKKTKK